MSEEWNLQCWLRFDFGNEKKMKGKTHWAATWFTGLRMHVGCNAGHWAMGRSMGLDGQPKCRVVLLVRWSRMLHL
jgi:hypothetical protein